MKWTLWFLKGWSEKASEKTKFSKDFKRVRGYALTIWRNSIPGNKNNTCKFPEVDVYWAYLRNNKKSGITGTKWRVEREIGDKVRTLIERDHMDFIKYVMIWFLHDDMGRTLEF